MFQPVSIVRDIFNGPSSASVPVFSLSKSSDRNVQGSMRNVDDDEIESDNEEEGMGVVDGLAARFMESPISVKKNVENVNVVARMLAPLAKVKMDKKESPVVVNNILFLLWFLVGDAMRQGERNE